METISFFLPFHSLSLAIHPFSYSTIPSLTCKFICAFLSLRGHSQIIRYVLPFRFSAAVSMLTAPQSQRAIAVLVTFLGQMRRSQVLKPFKHSTKKWWWLSPYFRKVAVPRWTQNKVAPNDRPAVLEELVLCAWLWHFTYWSSRLRDYYQQGNGCINIYV